nr:unnamed protein product [Callosobruchus chinensis]
MCTPSGARATVAFTAWRWKSARRQLSLAEPLAGDHGTTGQQHSSLSRHRCHRAVLQPLGQDPHARAVSAQISGGASSGSVAPSVGGPGMGAGTGHRPSCPLAPLSPPGGLGQVRSALCVQDASPGSRPWNGTRRRPWSMRSRLYVGGPSGRGH